MSSANLKNIEAHLINVKREESERFKKDPLTDFKILTKLGKGSWGVVYLAYNIRVKKLFAVKKLDKKQIEENN